MNASTNGRRKRALVFAALACVSFCASYILAPLGNFAVWIFGGATVYLLFLAIYALVPGRSSSYRKTRFNPREEETRAYIAFHKPILTSVFLAGVLLVLFILLMVL
ncbi:MAG TPA: hypothetical protein VF490_13755 [Chryseosolibacter sp.]